MRRLVVAVTGLGFVVAFVVVLLSINHLVSIQALKWLARPYLQSISRIQSRPFREDNISFVTISAVDSALNSKSTPDSLPSAIPDRALATSRWLFSQHFSSSSPLLMSIASLEANGAKKVDHRYLDKFWAQGFPTRHIYTGIPIYASSSSDRLLTVSCGIYGKCNANLVQIHENPDDYIQQSSDAHLLLVDRHAPSGPIEIDCWGSSITGQVLNCKWAGLYRLDTNGLHGIYQDQTAAGMEGIHFGPAAGTFMVTGTEILAGHIDHALALTVSCLNDPSIYPADSSLHTDKDCDGSRTPPHYGNVIHLLWSRAKIAASLYSAACKTVLTAMATYGAYPSDTGDYGIVIDVEAQQAYLSVGARDPYPEIESELNAAGDADGGMWMGCFNRLKATDFEMIELARPGR